MPGPRGPGGTDLGVQATKTLTELWNALVMDTRQDYLPGGGSFCDHHHCSSISSMARLRPVWDDLLFQPAPSQRLGALIVSTPTATTPSTENLSLHEMLQIMDVARAIRDEQLTVEQQFQIEETRGKIRERLIASAQVAGDNVTAAEVDVVIQLYFDNLNVYRDPPWGFQRLLAQLYVWRVQLVSAVAGVGAIGLGVWLAFFNPAMPWSSQSRATQAVRQAEQEARSVLDRLNGFAKKDEAATLAIDELTKEFRNAEATDNVAAIQQSQRRTAELLASLEEQYELQIVTGAGRYSLVTKEWTKGENSLGYYAIVEARSRDGRILSRAIQDAETGESRSVSQWGEQIPKEVYDRLRADKASDGVLNETDFAEKKRGALNEQVLLPGSDGQPVKRGMQITDWDRSTSDSRLPTPDSP